jgi:hypothetical protein
MAEPRRDYHMWQDGVQWHWELMSVRGEVIASGVTGSSSAARKAVFGFRPKSQDHCQMAIYFFDLNGSRNRDSEGQEFPNDDAARREAAAVARDLSRNQNVVTADGVVVTNADGIVIHEEPLFPCSIRNVGR